jgi:hypothetical protein
LALWYVRKQGAPFIVLLFFSTIAFVSVPIQGGHHVVDVLGGTAFAAAGIAITSRVQAWIETMPRLMFYRSPSVSEIMS